MERVVLITSVVASRNIIGSVKERNVDNRGSDILTHTTFRRANGRLLRTDVHNRMSSLANVVRGVVVKRPVPLNANSVNIGVSCGGR